MHRSGVRPCSLTCFCTRSQLGPGRLHLPQLWLISLWQLKQDSGLEKGEGGDRQVGPGLACGPQESHSSEGIGDLMHSKSLLWGIMSTVPPNWLPTLAFSPSLTVCATASGVCQAGLQHSQTAGPSHPQRYLVQEVLPIHMRTCEMRLYQYISQVALIP